MDYSDNESNASSSSIELPNLVICEDDEADQGPFNGNNHVESSIEIADDFDSFNGLSLEAFIDENLESVIDQQLPKKCKFKMGQRLTAQRSDELVVDDNTLEDSPDLVSIPTAPAPNLDYSNLICQTPEPATKDNMSSEFADAQNSEQASLKDVTDTILETTVTEAVPSGNAQKNEKHTSNKKSEPLVVSSRDYNDRNSLPNVPAENVSANGWDHIGSEEPSQTDGDNAEDVDGLPSSSITINSGGGSSAASENLITNDYITVENIRSQMPFGLIKEHFTCRLCNGMLVDVCSIIECLHSFCRSCLIHHLYTSTCCPTCLCQLNPVTPFKDVKFDPKIQDLVKAVFPDAHEKEVENRTNYYWNMGVAPKIDKVYIDSHNSVLPSEDYTKSHNFNKYDYSRVNLLHEKSNKVWFKVELCPKVSTNKRFLQVIEKFHQSNSFMACPCYVRIGAFYFAIHRKLKSLGLKNLKVNFKIFYKKQLLPKEITVQALYHTYHEYGEFPVPIQIELQPVYSASSIIASATTTSQCQTVSSLVDVTSSRCESSPSTKGCLDQTSDLLTSDDDAPGESHVGKKKGKRRREDADENGDEGYLLPVESQTLVDRFRDGKLTRAAAVMSSKTKDKLPVATAASELNYSKIKCFYFNHLTDQTQSLPNPSTSLEQTYGMFEKEVVIPIKPFSVGEFNHAAGSKKNKSRKKKKHKVKQT